MLGIIGGSGFATLEGLEIASHERLVTRYGEPSAPVAVGRLRGQPVAFLARHGEAHSLPPHRIDYRANIAALGLLGVRGILAIATVGGIGEAFATGTLVVPDQIVDYTSGRAATFSDGPPDPVVHVDFTHPFDAALRRRLLDAAQAASVAVLDGGTYGCTNGPRLESAAEIVRLRRDGCDLVGMTLMPEAALAREAGIPYAALCVVVNAAAGTGDSRERIDEDAMRAARAQAMRDVRLILPHAATAAT